MLPCQTGICNETPELCGGNIIKLVKEGNEEERDDIRPISHLAVARPGPGRSGHARQIKAPATRKKAKGALSMLIPGTNIF